LLSSQKKSNMKIGILGYGEIGQAISQFYEEVFISDSKKGNNFPDKLDLLHVCIPFKDLKEFNSIIVEYDNKYNPDIIIIHSTVKVGTVGNLNKELKGKVVHCPIRVVHPFLYKGIKTFKMFLGCDNKKIGKKAVDHLSSLGIDVCQVNNSKNTELGKLLDTTYYGLCIAFHDYANKLCQIEDIDFDVVMTQFNKTYNEGYIKLDKSNVVRPVLYAPDGKIGGHCIIPNAKILSRTYDYDSLLDSILRLE
jgi:hypothetical protein